MIEYCLPNKLVHVTAVIASGALFLICGSLVQGGQSRAMAALSVCGLMYLIARSQDPPGPFRLIAREST